MKVLIVVESFPNISETFVLNHIKGLLDAGVEVKIFTLNGKKGIAHPVYEQYALTNKAKVKPKLPANFAKRYILGFVLFYRCFLAFPRQTLTSINFLHHGMVAIKLIPLYELALFATKEKFDIVHCHFGIMGEKVAGYQLQGLLQAPLIVSFHGYDADSPHIVSNLNFYNKLKKRSDAYFVNSNYTLKKIAALGFDINKATVIPASLDISFFKRSVQPACKSLIRLITVGRLIPVKGIEFTINALAELKNKIGNTFEYIIIGEGQEEQKLKALCGELNLEGTVQFVGNQLQDEVREYLSSSDIFLLTGIVDNNGRQEGQGLVIQEAQAMELPVIVSNIGGTSEGLIDGGTGFLVEQKNINQIVDCLLRLINDTNLRVEMGKRGRKYVEDGYSIEATTKKILAEYKRMISNSTHY